MRHLIESRGLSDQFFVDSAGTGSWHVGQSPHRDSIDVAAHHGLDISHQKSRQIHGGDLIAFDWVVVMDRSNLQDVLDLGPPKDKHDRVRLLLDFGSEENRKDVPDPYYEGGFEGVYQLIYQGCSGFLDHILSDQ